VHFPLGIFMTRYIVKSVPERYQVNDAIGDDRERVGAHRRWVGNIRMIVNHLEDDES
jgi:hypothetical protein